MFVQDLFESPTQDVKQMFANVQLSDSQKDLVAREFKWAQRTLKKSERIIWWMRLWRLVILQNLWSGTLDDDERAIHMANFEKASMQYQKKGNITKSEVNEMLSMFGTIKSNLVHYLSLDIKEIDETVFGWKTPWEIMAIFADAEKEWQDRDRFNLKINPKHDLVLELADGWGWWDLNTPACSEEGQAMGHCGNSPRSETSDTILSLRQLVTVKGQQMLQPHATFVLQDGGTLTEMKGRFNEKPSKKLHPYIVALIKSDIVDYVVGGGYLPENNFHYDDLDNNADIEAVKEKWKPTLAEVYAKEGLSGKFMDLLREKLYDNSMSIDELYPATGESKADPGDPVMVIHVWSNFEEFIDEIDDNIVKELLDVYDDATDVLDTARETIDDEYYYSVLESLPDRERGMIFNELGIEDKGRKSNIDAIDALKSQDSRFLEYMDDAHDKAFTEDPAHVKKIEAQAMERIKKYIDEGWGFGSSYNIWIDIDKDKLDLNTPIEMKVPLSTLITAVDSVEEEYWEHDDINLYQIQSEGWHSHSYEDAAYLRQVRYDENLIEPVNDKNEVNRGQYRDSWLEDLDGIEGDFDFPKAMDIVTKHIRLNESKDAVDDLRMMLEKLHVGRM